MWAGGTPGRVPKAPLPEGTCFAQTARGNDVGRPEPARSRRVYHRPPIKETEMEGGRSSGASPGSSAATAAMANAPGSGLLAVQLNADGSVDVTTVIVLVELEHVTVELLGPNAPQ